MRREVFILRIGDRQIDYFRDEFDLSYAEAVGVLELVKHDLIAEELGEHDD